MDLEVSSLSPGEVLEGRLRCGHDDPQIMTETSLSLRDYLARFVLQVADRVLAGVLLVPDAVQQSHNEVIVCLQLSVEAQSLK